MKIKRLILSAILVAPITAFSSDDAVDAAQILTQFSHTRPSQLIGSFGEVELEVWFGKILRGVETGRKEWLDVAVELHPATDASYSEALSISVAIALAHNPGNALAVSHKGFPLAHMCSIPLIEPAEKEFYSLLDRTIEAVQSATLPTDLEARRQVCLGHLLKTKAAVSGRPWP